jgi:high-affinity Fe2+/Pb2+ permease
MSPQLIWGTVIVVLAIFGLFFYGAFRADKVVAAKATAKREAMRKTGNKTKKA